MMDAAKKLFRPMVCRLIGHMPVERQWDVGFVEHAWCYRCRENLARRAGEKWERVS